MGDVKLNGLEEAILACKNQLMGNWEMNNNSLQFCRDILIDIQQGLFIKLPCEVGDTIFIPWKLTDEDGDVQSGIAFPKVTAIVIKQHETIICTDLEMDDCGYMEEYADQLARGKDKQWFLAREQAKERLKELNE